MPSSPEGIDPERLWGAVIATALSLGATVALAAPALTRLLPACGFRALTGLPCPTCGSTRAVLALADGRLLAALAHNPLAILVLGGAMIYLGYALGAILGLVPRVRTGWLTPPMPVGLRVGLPALLMANWIWLLVQGS